MNNNKKYKKWSLGLVAPALVLAPIAVVASCSSSGEEKPAYGVTFTNNDKIKATIHKAVKPTALTDVQFKEEVLAHKSDLFSIEGTLPSDSFLNDNIEISNLDASDDNKTVSANVKLNKANTNGESIEKTITLTGLGYVEVDLNGKTYTIEFKDKQDSQEIELADQSGNSVEGLTSEQLMKLVIGKKDEILTITDDQKIITDEVLENQILEISNPEPNKVEGKITFKLSVQKPVNGEGATLEKNISFTGFKKETDSTPATEYQIALQDKDTEGKYTLTTVGSQTTEDFPDANSIKGLIIKEKSVIFKAIKGELPTDESWWNTNLEISGQPSSDATKGEINVTIQLSNSDSSDNSQKINEKIILKGFQQKPATPTTGEPTTIKSEVSTVTLGLNGSLNELKAEVNEQWIFDKKAILFQKGFEPITADGISSVRHESITGENGKFTLKFKISADKYFGADGNLAKSEQEFSITVKGISANDTATTELKNKSGNPLSIALVDPALAEKTFDEYLADSANIFTKEFVFKYRKHLLTGDFSKIDSGTANNFLKDYGNPANSFVKVIPNNTGKTIEIKFTILKEKLVGQQTPADKEYSITFNGFS